VECDLKAGQSHLLSWLRQKHSVNVMVVAPAMIFTERILDGNGSVGRLC
jgi:hypothetical protein